ncbi:hypothetical protein HID58_091527, partial [Brassica napus]
KEGETRREVEELRRKLAIEKKRMNRVKLCSSMELLLLVVLVLLLSTFFLNGSSSHIFFALFSSQLLNKKIASSFSSKFCSC